MHIGLKKTLRTSLNNVIFYIDKESMCMDFRTNNQEYKNENINK
jgi:hypothetical protein